MQHYREMILGFIAELTPYDYVGFALVLLLFVILLVLAILLKHKTFLSLLLFLMGFLTLLGGPFGVYKVVHTALYGATVVLEEEQKLFYTPALLIGGVLTYGGKMDASGCRVIAYVHKTDDNPIKNFVHRLKPYKQGETLLEKTFVRGDTLGVRIAIEPYLYEGNHTITLKAECYR
ncbi:MAG: hypothetical protein KU28_01130 [Sulfurovum sp. PC08-66]|nr:MAG: hypothetical protein KU28_01130 [Sulfurovum sp. PC08-66]KIM12559.1 MAG: hypothetical protein KU37_01245 [Sulfuricurvum sp. PC08-66]